MLVHGDCLVSIVSEREVDSAVFDGVVTRRTETHEVGQIVRIVRGGERADRLDMVDVERLPVRDGLAAAARSTVSGSRRALCRAPIGAVILRVSALPSGVVGPLPEGVAARERAEVKSRLPQPTPLRILKGRAAVGTQERPEHAHAPELRCASTAPLVPRFREHVWPSNNALRGARRAALVVACSRAEYAVFGPLELRCCALDKGAAHPARMRRFRADIGGRYGCIATLSRARLLESDLDSVFRSAERASAHLARCVNHLGHVGSVTHERSGRK